MVTGDTSYLTIDTFLDVVVGQLIGIYTDKVMVAIIDRIPNARCVIPVIDSVVTH